MTPNLRRAGAILVLVLAFAGAVLAVPPAVDAVVSSTVFWDGR